jgi:deoxycytidine triphosphate deaminase
MTILSKEAIIEEIAKGNIIFTGKDSQIGNQSIDVSLGSEIFYNTNTPPCEWEKVSIIKPFDLAKSDFFLAYTNEFVGTRIGSNIHCQFQQTSTSARLGLIHPKAGWGDVGFVNRWAMEFFVAKDITIQAGDIVGQMSFMYTTPTKEDYSLNGQYQDSNDLELLKKTWTISNILPKKKRLKNVKDLK